MKFTIFATSLALASIGYVSAGGIRRNSECSCTFEYRPVCVLGQTYGNRCAAKCFNPNLDESNIVEGECPCVCTMERDPVCYKGNTYGNPCAARCAGAVDTELVHGECPTQKFSAPLCICTREYRPVCFKGVTYGNLCMAKCHGATDDKISRGEC